MTHACSRPLGGWTNIQSPYSHIYTTVYIYIYHKYIQYIYVEDDNGIWNYEQYILHVINYTNCEGSTLDNLFRWRMRAPDHWMDGRGLWLQWGSHRVWCYQVLWWCILCLRSCFWYFWWCIWYFYCVAYFQMVYMVLEFVQDFYMYDFAWTENCMQG